MDWKLRMFDDTQVIESRSTACDSFTTRYCMELHVFAIQRVEVSDVV